MHVPSSRTRRAGLLVGGYALGLVAYTCVPVAFASNLAADAGSLQTWRIDGGVPAAANGPALQADPRATEKEPGKPADTPGPPDAPGRTDEAGGSDEAPGNPDAQGRSDEAPGKPDAPDDEARVVDPDSPSVLGADEFQATNVAADLSLTLAACGVLDGYSHVLVGTDGDDVLDATGLEGSVLVIGLGGADVLQGAEGADCLVGGDGDDLLIGVEGADVLEGGLGQDEVRAEDAAE